jgi:hypothetical protein
MFYEPFRKVIIFIIGIIYLENNKPLYLECVARLCNIVMSYWLCNIVMSYWLCNIVMSSAGSKVVISSMG